MSVKFSMPADARQDEAGKLSSLTTTEKGSLVGAVNELNSKLTNQNVGSSFSGNENFTMSGKNAYRNGNIVEFRAIINGEINAGFINVGSTTLLPVFESEMYVRDADNSNVYVGRITVDGKIQIYRWSNLTQSSGHSMFVSTMYITAS